MERITGIGGFFFRSRDPDALGRWYEEYFGIVAPAGSYEAEVWEQERGQTVFAAFDHDSGFFGPAEKQWAVNFRVRDIEAMVAQLRDAAIEVDMDDGNPYPNGVFADLRDPEGNRIQLWQPA